jgi:hypothetical protein
MALQRVRRRHFGRERLAMTTPLKKAKDCDCGCHSGAAIVHVVPCCDAPLPIMRIPSVTDNDVDKRAAHQRALLHGAPQPAPRQPNPGELLMAFEYGQDSFRVELRDFQPHGVETQILQNGVLLAACRFTVRALAVVWAEQKRAQILNGGARR